jgi:hypothetical protein
MPRRLLSIASIILCLACAARAQTPTPTPEAMTAARSLVTTMKLADQYKAILPGILLGLRRPLTQDRPEIERDFDAMIATTVDTFAPYYERMLDAAAAIYASNFTVDELHQIEAFYRQPGGKKLLEKAPAIAQQIQQIGQDAGRKAADDLRTKLIEGLRARGHKL